MPNGYVEYRLRKKEIKPETAKTHAIVIRQFFAFLDYKYPNENIELHAINSSHIDAFLTQQLNDLKLKETTVYYKQKILSKYFSFLYLTKQTEHDIMYGYTFAPSVGIQAIAKKMKVSFSYDELLQYKEVIYNYPKLNITAKMLFLLSTYGVQLIDMCKLKFENVIKDKDESNKDIYRIMYVSYQDIDTCFTISDIHDMAIISEAIEIAKSRNTNFLLNKKTDNIVYEQTTPFHMRYYVERLGQILGFPFKTEEIRAVVVKHMYFVNRMHIEDICKQLGRSHANIYSIINKNVERQQNNDYNKAVPSDPKVYVQQSLFS